MNLKAQIALFFILIYTNFTADTKAQVTRQNSWHRIAFQTHLKKNLRLITELQHRRQNDFDNKNPYSQGLTNSFRLWLDYHKSDHLSFGFSPFAYFEQYPTFKEASDHLKIDQKEIRFATSVTAQKPLFRDFSAFTKLGLEYRSFINKGDQLRLREKIGLNYHYKSLTISTFDELFLNIAGVQPTHLFDQNRICGAVNLQANHLLGLEMGYIHSHKLPGQTTQIQKEHILYINLTFTIDRNKS